MTNPADVAAADAIPADVLELARKTAETACRNLDYDDVSIEVDAIARAILADRARSPLAAPVAEGWRDMASAPKDGTHVLLNIGETIPDLVDARVGQFIVEKDAVELGEMVSASGGWFIWTRDNDWFVIPHGDAFGWSPLPGTAPSGTADVEPIAWLAWSHPYGGYFFTDKNIADATANSYGTGWAKAAYAGAHPPTVEVREPDAELVRELEKLERAASEVARYGACTGAQWTRLSSALITARALIAKHGGDRS